MTRGGPKLDDRDLPPGLRWLDASEPCIWAASTWADGKNAQHLLSDGRAALCGLDAGLHGWDNCNYVVPDLDNPTHCKGCLAVLKE